jgi:hypothetical protein
MVQRVVCSGEALDREATGTDLLVAMFDERESPSITGPFSREYRDARDTDSRSTMARLRPRRHWPMWYHNAEIGHLMRHVATPKRRGSFLKTMQTGSGGLSTRSGLWRTRRFLR